MGTIGRISYPDSGRIGKLSDLFALLAGSVDAALPVKFVDTLDELNGVGLTSSTPAGTLATLAADDSGLSAGAEFVLTPDGKWKLSGSCSALNVDTFVTALTSLNSVRVLPGAQVWDAVTDALVVFTTAAGAYISTTATKIIHGAGTMPSPLAISGTFSVAVAFPTDSFATEPSNVVVTVASSRLNPAALTTTKDGFTVNISNWSNAIAPAVDYKWSATA